MLRRISLTCRCSIALVFAVLAQLSLQAQQIAAIDLTQMTARTDLRRPPSLPGTPDGSSGAHEIRGCPNFQKSIIGALRTTLVSLDRTEYKVGDEAAFEVTIENIGSTKVQIPFSPHLADLQPEDPSLKFIYLDLSVVLWLGGNSGRRLQQEFELPYKEPRVTLKPF